MLLLGLVFSLVDVDPDWLRLSSLLTVFLGLLGLFIVASELNRFLHFFFDLGSGHLITSNDIGRGCLAFRIVALVVDL